MTSGTFLIDFRFQIPDFRCREFDGMEVMP
jgi:hypothetical protein